MQYGVYVDWFDSVGIASETYRFSKEDFESIVINFNNSDNETRLGFVNSRHEARTKAIEKANEIYNSK